MRCRWTGPAAERGFNLIELLMALGLASVIFMAITMLYTYQAASGSCVSPPHGSMARDGCMPSDTTSGLPAGLGYGRPHLFEPYVYLFCAAGTFDPNTCTAYSDQSRTLGPRL